MNPLIRDLLAGNREHTQAFRDRFDSLQSGQRPDAVTVCCSDSRVLQDDMWNNAEPGRLFTCGNVGNRVILPTEDGPVVSGDVLYPLTYTGTRIVIVVGHTRCGAITATFEEQAHGRENASGLSACLDLLDHGLAGGIELLPPNLSTEMAVNYLVEYNVDRQIAHLLDSPDVPETTLAIGAVYDFCDVYPGDRGELHLINVGGERSVERLRSDHTEVAHRIRRLWAY